MMELALEFDAPISMDRRQDYVRQLWLELYADYRNFHESEELRAAVDVTLSSAEPEQLLGNWSFVLFRLANEDLKAGHVRSERDFVVTMQDRGVIAYDRRRSERVMLHTA